MSLNAVINIRRQEQSPLAVVIASERSPATEAIFSSHPILKRAYLKPGNLSLVAGIVDPGLLVIKDAPWQAQRASGFVRSLANVLCERGKRSIS
jgi:hypothetical protein